MRLWLGLALVLPGCSKKPPAAAVDPELPEARAEVASVDPVHILIEGAESVDPTPRATARCRPTRAGFIALRRREARTVSAGRRCGAATAT